MVDQDRIGTAAIRDISRLLLEIVFVINIQRIAVGLVLRLILNGTERQQDESDPTPATRKNLASFVHDSPDFPTPRTLVDRSERFGALVGRMFFQRFMSVAKQSFRALPIDAGVSD